MVERERELDALQRAFERAASGGSSQLFTILGAAGVGKSRLVAEFLGSVRDRARVLRGRCLPYGEGITYLPVADIVRQAAGIQEGDAADTERERIDALVAGLPEATAIARGLASLIGLEAAAAQEELVWAFRRMLEHLADSKSLVVLVDDIHWAEPTLLDLIDSVADLTRGSPILFICPARPEFLDDRPTWGGGRLNATSVLLEPLSEGSALELIDALVPGGALSPAVRARIADGAEGNPLYVEEFVGMLIDDGALVASVDGWSASGDLDSIAVPPTIQALLSARLDRLGSDERAAAERASVVGRVFEQPAVVAMTPSASRSEIPRNLSALVRKELIRPDRSGLTPWETFRFRHVLIRDAAYERLPKSERAELHELFADWLDETLGDRRAEVEEIVGYHLEQAFRYRAELAPVDERTRELARRAAQVLIAAGGRGLERSDVAATVNLYGRAATLLDPDDPARLTILPDLGRALDSNGRFDDAQASFDAAVKRSEASGDQRAIAHARVAQYLFGDPGNQASGDELRRIADECSAVFEPLHDDRGLALAWRLRGAASWKNGNVAGDEVALERALVHARRAGSHWEVGSIVGDLSVDFYWGPTPVPKAIRVCSEIRIEDPDDRAIEASIAHALAHMHARLGDFELARSLAARCIEISAESGQRTDAAVLNEVAADVETLAGNHEVAERMLAEGCDWFIAMGKKHFTLEALHALTQVDCGLPVDVERLADMTAGRAPETRALLETAMAAAHLAAGRLSEAERDARSAVDYFATTDFITFHANSAVILGDVLRAAGRRSEANASYQQALDLYGQKGSLVSVQTAAARLAS
jgi:tetratricopeptide (TPR) repeat protein